MQRGKDIEQQRHKFVKRGISDASRRTPGPWRITLVTNPDDCNLHCVMCEGHSYESPVQQKRLARGEAPRRMDVALMRQAIDQAAQMGALREVIPSTMGEPLLYQHMDELLDLCKRYRVKLNLTTNGTFPGRGAQAWADVLVPITSDVKISFNGATDTTQEAIMRGTQWERVMENLRTFIAVRDAYAQRTGSYCRVTFQVTCLETNVAEMPDIVRLAASLGVARVKGHHVWVHWPAIAHLSMRRNADAQQRWNAIAAQCHAVADVHRLPDGRRVLLEGFVPLETQAATEQLDPSFVCPFLGREAWVNWRGDFAPCCAPNEQRQALGNFGTLAKRSLMEIWEDADYRHLVATYQEHPLCQTCLMRRRENTATLHDW